MCRESSQILLSHREAQRGAPDQHFVLGVKLFNSPSLNLFTNYLVRGNTYQLPVSANKPPALFLSFLEDRRDLTKKKRVNAPYKLEDMTWQRKTCVFITFYFLLDTTFMYILSPLETGCIEKERWGWGGGEISGLKQITFYDRT